MERKSALYVVAMMLVVAAVAAVIWAVRFFHEHFAM